MEKYEIKKKGISDFGATTRFRKRRDVLSGLFCAEKKLFFQNGKFQRGKVDGEEDYVIASRCRIFRMILDENSNRASGEPRRMSS